MQGWVGGGALALVERGALTLLGGLPISFSNRLMMLICCQRYDVDLLYVLFMNC